MAKEDAKMNVCGYCGDEQGRATTFSKGVSPGPSVISEQTKIDLIITELTRALEAAQREKRAAYTEEEEDEIVGEISGLTWAIEIVKKVRGKK